GSPRRRDLACRPPAAHARRVNRTDRLDALVEELRAVAPRPRTARQLAEVTDVAATCARVEELGGKVLVPATTTPAGIVLAHVADPAGNHIGLWTPAPAA